MSGNFIHIPLMDLLICSSSYILLLSRFSRSVSYIKCDFFFVGLRVGTLILYLRTSSFVALQCA